MKIRTSILVAMTFVLASCGTSAQMASTSEQRLQDGLYSNNQSDGPAKRTGQSREEEQVLAQKTRNSTIYMINEDKQEAVVVPDNMAARFDFDQGSISSMTIVDNPYDRYDGHNSINLNIGFGPWWDYNYAWNRPWHYRHYDPWYWHRPGYGWYDPWYSFGGWYDPWYNGWYDPWYSCGGWYDPWYSPWYPAYVGFPPYYHPGGYYPGHVYPGIVVVDKRDRYYGSRNGVSSGRVSTSSSTSRGSGISSSSSARRGYTRVTSRNNQNMASTDRRVPVTSAGGFRHDTDRKATLGITRTTVNSGRTPSRNNSSSLHTNSQNNSYRGSASNSNSGYNRGSSSSSRNSGYSRGSSSSSSSSRNSSYSRGSSNTSSRGYSNTRSTQYRRPASSNTRSSYNRSGSSYQRNNSSSSDNRSSYNSGSGYSRSSSYNSGSSYNRSSSYGSGSGYSRSSSSSSSSSRSTSTSGMRR